MLAQDPNTLPLAIAAPLFRGRGVEDPPDASNWSDNLMDKEATETDWNKKAAKPYGVVGCGRLGCKVVAGNGWGEEAAGDERAWLRGRLRMAWSP